MDWHGCKGVFNWRRKLASYYKDAYSKEYAQLQKALVPILVLTLGEKIHSELDDCCELNILYKCTHICRLYVCKNVG